MPPWHDLRPWMSRGQADSNAPHLFSSLHARCERRRATSTGTHPLWVGRGEGGEDKGEGRSGTVGQPPSGEASEGGVSPPSIT